MDCNFLTLFFLSFKFFPTKRPKKNTKNEEVFLSPKRIRIKRENRVRLRARQSRFERRRRRRRLCRRLCRRRARDFGGCERRDAFFFSSSSGTERERPRGFQLRTCILSIRQRRGGQRTGTDDGTTFAAARETPRRVLRGAVVFRSRGGGASEQTGPRRDVCVLHAREEGRLQCKQKR